jgi:hypothetical protein
MTYACHYNAPATPCAPEPACCQVAAISMLCAMNQIAAIIGGGGGGAGAAAAAAAH